MRRNSIDTHDPERRSWVASANGHPDFPIQNLPFGVFSPLARRRDARGVAIGDADPRPAGGFSRGPVHRRGGACRRRWRPTARSMRSWPPAPGRGRRFAARLSELLTEGAAEQAKLQACCTRRRTARCTCRRHIGDYTDFYVGIHHATNVGKQFRPDNPLLPNYKYVPIGYHGRASSVCPSGTPVRRPTVSAGSADAQAPGFGPSRRLDYELELGDLDCGRERAGRAHPHRGGLRPRGGFCLLNDWSARDIQAWEYQPLGSVPGQELRHERQPLDRDARGARALPRAAAVRPADDPAPLPYLLERRRPAEGRAAITSSRCCCRRRVCRRRDCRRSRCSVTSARHLVLDRGADDRASHQQRLQSAPGDLLGSGTISSPTPDGYGSLLEITEGGRRAIALASGRYAHVPRGRGRGDHPRARRTRRLRLHRPRRCPGHRHAVRSIGRVGKVRRFAAPNVSADCRLTLSWPRGQRGAWASPRT